MYWSIPKHDYSDYIILPVPIHKKKLIIRGYNQSVILGRQIAKKINITIVVDGLIRIKNTKAQYLLNATERETNLQNSIVFNPQRSKLLDNKKIILIDDIYTTGATVNACVNALQTNNCQVKYIFCIAKTLNENFFK